MGTIYENILNLCEEKGIKAGKMCGDLQLSRSLMTDLKAGRKKGVTDKTAVKIAEYFGVSVDRVFGVEKEKDPAGEGEVTDDAIKFALAGDAGKILTDDDMEKIRAFAAWTAQERRQKNE